MEQDGRGRNTTGRDITPLHESYIAPTWYKNLVYALFQKLKNIIMKRAG